MNSMADERTVSNFTWFNSSLRNRQNVGTLTRMIQIRQWVLHLGESLLSAWTDGFDDSSFDILPKQEDEAPVEATSCFLQHQERRSTQRQESGPTTSWLGSRAKRRTLIGMEMKSVHLKTESWGSMVTLTLPHHFSAACFQASSQHRPSRISRPLRM
jgi:hypothetical protein